MGKVVKVFSTCRVVSGFTRGAVYDLTRNKYYLVPLEFCTFIRQVDGISVSEFKKITSDKQLGEYIEFMKEKELVFFVNEEESSCFEDMAFTYDSPSVAHTIIFEIDDKLQFDLPNFLHKTRNIGLENAAFFSKHTLGIQYIDYILNSFRSTRFQQVEIICKYDPVYSPETYFPLFHTAPRLRKMSLHAAPSDNIYHAGGESARLFTFTESLDCFPTPLADYGYFKVNVPFFTESMVANPFYNKKVFIDATGNLKNTPYTSEHFGHIDQVDILEKISDADFQALWHTVKDSIDVCRDCEFRYMCMDSRVPSSGYNNRLYHEQECNYNPYLCKWAGEMEYTDLKSCGVTIDRTTHIIDASVIREMIHAIYQHE